ncbi:MAG TPA: hypothetical protein VMU65_07405 [Candidatus Saccharimonadales bacterium]|nr:hypothetical protein [Candidatus Saccharimonadales bacterium]
MPRSRSPLLLFASVGALMLAACSGTAAATPTPTHPPTATPSPTPLPPDTLTVSVLASGVGTFDLAAFPVANLRNNASSHGAAMVKAHFVTHRSGKTLGSLESIAVNLGPGEALAVSADCTDACDGATSVSVTVTVGSWPIDVGPIFTTAAAAYSCSPCRTGHGFGNVKGTLKPSVSLVSGSPVVAFAVCHNAGGTILGGGTGEFVWPGGTSFAVDVPVVLNAAPSSCALGASSGW